MKTNEFEKGKKFSFGDRIEYAENAIVSKHILKKISFFETFIVPVCL